MPSQAWAQAPQTAPGGPVALITSLFPFILIFVVFYFLIIRPQKKRQQEHQKLVDNLKKGDRVLLSSGLIATIAGVQKDRIVLRVSDTVKLEYQKSAVAAVLDEKADAAAKGDAGE
jgi:preprotein translocase subunit YajC